MKRWQNGSVPMDGTEMDYVAFGRGKEPLVMIPGLGDGLRTVRGMARTFAMQYRELARRFRVYCFSRKRVQPPGRTR